MLHIIVNIIIHFVQTPANVIRKHLNAITSCVRKLDGISSTAILYHFVIFPHIVVLHRQPSEFDFGTEFALAAKIDETIKVIMITKHVDFAALPIVDVEQLERITIPYSVGTPG